MVAEPVALADPQWPFSGVSTPISRTRPWSVTTVSPSTHRITLAWAQVTVLDAASAGATDSTRLSATASPANKANTCFRLPRRGRDGTAFVIRIFPENVAAGPHPAVDTWKG